MGSQHFVIQDRDASSHESLSKSLLVIGLTPQLLSPALVLRGVRGGRMDGGSQ